MKHDPLISAIDNYWKTRSELVRANKNLEALLARGLEKRWPITIPPSGGYVSFPHDGYVAEIIERIAGGLTYRVYGATPKTERIMRKVPERERVFYLTSMIAVDCRAVEAGEKGNGLAAACDKVIGAQKAFHTAREKISRSKPQSANAAKSGLQFLIRVNHGSMNDPSGGHGYPPAYTRGLLVNCQHHIRA